MKAWWLAAWVLVLVAAVGTPALANCSCSCVNGQPQALCTSVIDIRPICMPEVCPIFMPSVAPIQMPTVPPLGTQTCQQAQVLNRFSGQYEWQQVCR